ncbi:hypothetical protein [Burkholderia aenigmatica]|uniref:hypothetical protein n=1 Tax=Burkholderia aenigmatica TaxID=2015348 RepID=UPI001177B72F|nr:hypothetical protein [Burkholderia aenigmatica]
MRSTTHLAVIDGIACRTAGNRRGPFGIRYRGDRAVTAHADPRGPTLRQRPRQADPARCRTRLMEGKAGAIARRTVTRTTAHVRQEANRVGPAEGIGSKQVQVDDV